MKRASFLLSCCLSFLIAAAQPVSSPQVFLGYELGSHFTPHNRIVSYFREVVAQVPGMVRLEQYGETYEGRPLLLAFISSPSNLQKLESIRQNNLRIAGLLKDNVSPDLNVPAIVWLSYNVHGNEPSSSEAAMKTLYELVNPANQESKEWLGHVVVVIDPCINPDGRDRYVNWFNGTVGKWPNPDPLALEHREHWPSGRTNHYLFDLNRDWAWQTQQETRQRLKKYNEWLPQVHVDFHEQGYNSPYYFAPAAEPYHEVITKWQRQFQEMVGRNNAKYFDRNGWLFFTKEEFDLLYPSYGDTYPMYNGAIGMTFEQGGISAGLAVRTQDGDTLRLADRIMHHFTTGMSTIEISAQHAGELVQEFRKYFSPERIATVGDYRSYVVLADPYSERIGKIKELLDRNGIEWSLAPVGTYSGVNIETGKTEECHSRSGDIVINTNQSKAALIKVLFDRNAKISDSATYDITAWSLPMVYDLEVVGLNHPVKGMDRSASGDTSDPALPAAYAYAVKWTGVHSARFLATLLRQGVKVLFSEPPFSAGKENFQRGTLLITSAGNRAAALPAVIQEAARRAGVQCFPITSGLVDKGYDLGSNRIHMIHPPRVAVFAGDGVSSAGAGEVWYFFEQEVDYPVTLINSTSADQLNWQN